MIPVRSRLGLALTGGSCRCAFQAGVLQALDERGYRFDVVSGVSSGAWNAAAVAAGSIHRLRELWLGATAFPVYSLRNLAFNRTPFNYLHMHHHFTRHALDFEAIRASALLWMVSLTRVRDLSPVVFTNRDHPELDAFELTLATNTLPPIYPWPARVGGRLYVDGGFTNNAPYEPVIAEGCERVVLIANHEDGSIFKSVRDRRHEVPEGLRGRVRLIHPSRPMPVTFNDLDRGRVEDALDHGYEVGRRAEI
ncbi:MAG: patatin-like phospholipase family protein [Vicinamibacteria bacterium]